MILYYTIIKKIYGGFLIKNMPCFKKIISYKICGVLRAYRPSKEAKLDIENFFARFERYTHRQVF